MSATTACVVYECPGCEERFVDERRCPECNVFCRRIGPGGSCPSCGEIVVAEELAEG
jgi:ribosomal protein L32